MLLYVVMCTTSTALSGGRSSPTATIESIQSNGHPLGGATSQLIICDHCSLLMGLEIRDSIAHYGCEFIINCNATPPLPPPLCVLCHTRSRDKDIIIIDYFRCNQILVNIHSSCTDPGWLRCYSNDWQWVQPQTGELWLSQKPPQSIYLLDRFLYLQTMMKAPSLNISIIGWSVSVIYWDWEHYSLKNHEPSRLHFPS